MNTELKDLIGRKVLKVFLNDSFLKFETDKGNLVYEVDGDCCSHSYFYDFYGVENLLKNGEVKEVKEVQLDPTDLKVKNSNDYDDIKVYGFQITTEGEYGEVTAVFSFRNSSNGYYGGDIRLVNDQEVLPEITKDVIEVK